MMIGFWILFCLMVWNQLYLLRRLRELETAMHARLDWLSIAQKPQGSLGAPFGRSETVHNYCKPL